MGLVDHQTEKAAAAASQRRARQLERLVEELADMITDLDLKKLRSQTEFMAMGYTKTEWRLLADALKELQERREQELQKQLADPTAVPF